MNVTLPYIRKTLGACGADVLIGDHSLNAGAENIVKGNDDVYIGPEVLMYTTKAKYIFGRYIKSVSDGEKLPRK